ncbi:hypothetical protein H4R33_001043 [Dimargaris cristalligena]|nr:hypothetical protein H4R33_001043 [Dimargaris cristalligena]
MLKSASHGVGSAPAPVTGDNFAKYLKPWDELVCIVESGNFVSLNRTKEAEAIYSQAKQYYNRDYAGIADFVLKTRLKWTLEEIAETQRLVAAAHHHPPSSPTNPDRPIDAYLPFYPEYTRILVNDYPYALTPDIQHFVLWSQVELDIRNPKLMTHLQAKFPGYEVLFMVHVPALQSVRAIPHGHVFIRKQPLSEGSVGIGKSDSLADSTASTVCSAKSTQGS